VILDVDQQKSRSLVSPMPCGSRSRRQQPDGTRRCTQAFRAIISIGRFNPGI
jgi:hypothetical protein